MAKRGGLLVALHTLSLSLSYFAVSLTIAFQVQGAIFKSGDGRYDLSYAKYETTQAEINEREVEGRHKSEKENIEPDRRK